MAQDTASEQIDVLVVGAGFAGLSAAKVYLQCAPTTNLVIADYNESIGGTWCLSRIYPGLRSNNLLGTFEFPDYPMHAGFGVKEGEYIPGHVLHKYLCEYAEVFGLNPRIRLRTKIVSAEKIGGTEGEGRWRVLMVTEEQDERGKMERSKWCVVEKLIVATGLTSQTTPMHYKGDDAFHAPIIAADQLARESSKILDNNRGAEAKVTVIGGSKSSYDAVYLFASRGLQVNWVIRKSGFGSAVMSYSHVDIGPIKKVWVEPLSTMRGLSWLSPCIWGDADGYSWIRWLLHKTRLGRRLVDTFWQKLSDDTLEQSGLGRDPRLEALRPNQGAVWYSTSFAILNYPTNIHDFVISGQVKIHREDVSHLSRNTVHLVDGTKLDASVGLCTNANWTTVPNLKFTPSSIYSDMGFPSAEYTKEQRDFWQKLDQRAEKVVFDALPRLQSAPPKPGAGAPNAVLKSDAVQFTAADEQLQPIRMYRFMAPPGLTQKGDRSIAFAGFAANLLGQTRNHIGGIWCYAYLNDKLSRESKDYCWEAALANRFCVLRFPYGWGARYPDFVFEQMPYFDLLLKDLGLNSWRKKSWWREITEPYGPADFRGLTEEWLKMQSIDAAYNFKGLHSK